MTDGVIRLLSGRPPTVMRARFGLVPLLAIGWLAASYIALVRPASVGPLLVSGVLGTVLLVVLQVTSHHETAVEWHPATGALAFTYLDGLGRLRTRVLSGALAVGLTQGRVGNRLSDAWVLEVRTATGNWRMSCPPGTFARADLERLVRAILARPGNFAL